MRDCSKDRACGVVVMTIVFPHEPEQRKPVRAVWADVPSCFFSHSL